MSAALTLWNKHMIKLLSHGEEGFGVLFQPILWVVLFGTGMKSVMTSVMPGNGDAYITLMVPGIIALTAMSGAIQGGLTLLEERLLGIIKEYLVAPIPRISILMGNAMSTITKSLFQSAIILVIGILMGAKFIGFNPAGWLSGLLLITFFGLGFAGIGLAVASRTSTTGGYHMLIFMLTLPLMFLSNSLYPMDSLPTWMQIGSKVNPVSYVVDGLRQTLFDTGVPFSEGGSLPLWLCFLVVALFAIFGTLLSYVSFKKSVA
ncbi:ABC transporter permease [Chloroflexota bacterium]